MGTPTMLHSLPRTVRACAQRRFSRHVGQPRWTGAGPGAESVGRIRPFRAAAGSDAADPARRLVRLRPSRPGGRIPPGGGRGLLPPVRPARQDSVLRGLPASAKSGWSIWNTTGWRRIPIPPRMATAPCGATSPANLWSRRRSPASAWKWPGSSPYQLELIAEHLPEKVCLT